LQAITCGAVCQSNHFRVTRANEIVLHPDTKSTFSSGHSGAAELPARVSEAIEIERLFEPRQMGPRIRAFEFVLGETGPAGFD